MGGVEDFRNFVNAVISEKSFDKIAKYIEHARKDPKSEIIAGGGYDKSMGYFIEPTVIESFDPQSVTMCEETVRPGAHGVRVPLRKLRADAGTGGPDLAVRPDGFDLRQDRYAVELAAQKLVNAAGNFYINDKPTGAVVGQQPFGGSRASGTNDKAGSLLNLCAGCRPGHQEDVRAAYDFRYPFMTEE
jgi:1-pyrroline-5-carboxylate dehydrogenase